MKTYNKNCSLREKRIIHASPWHEMDEKEREEAEKNFRAFCAQYGLEISEDGYIDLNDLKKINKCDKESNLPRH